MSEPTPIYQAFSESASAMLARLEAQADRIDALYAAHTARLDKLEAVASQRIRGLEAQVASQHEALLLAGKAMSEVKAVCRRHGFEDGLGLSVLEWLEYVLDNAAAGWPSAN